MAQSAHRSFGQAYADQKTIKESEKRTPLLSPENGRELSEKRESTRSVVRSYKLKKATSCGKSGAILRPALEEKP